MRNRIIAAAIALGTAATAVGLVLANMATHVAAVNPLMYYHG